MEQTFGSYVREKRMARGLSLRGLAAKLEVSPVYMSNMENDRRPAPTKEKMDRLIEILGLCQADTELLLDLAAKSKTQRVSADLPEYIMEVSAGSGCKVQGTVCIGRPSGVYHGAGYCAGRPADSQGSGRHRRGMAGVYRPHHPAAETGKLK